MVVRWQVLSLQSTSDHISDSGLHRNPRRPPGRVVVSRAVLFRSDHHNNDDSSRYEGKQNLRRRLLSRNRTKLLIHGCMSVKNHDWMPFPGVLVMRSSSGGDLSEPLASVGPCKRTGPRREERAALPRAPRCSLFVPRITASYPSNPSKQSQKRHTVRQLRTPLRFITATRRAHNAPRKVTQIKKCLFDTGSTCNKSSEIYDQR